jgi:hypothetical protein
MAVVIVAVQGVAIALHLLVVALSALEAAGESGSGKVDLLHINRHSRTYHQRFFVVSALHLCAHETQASPAQHQVVTSHLFQA